MFKLKVTNHFSAAHRLDGYEGDCCNLHGHNWKVQVGILCPEQDDIGLTIDFREVKRLLKEVIDTVDHKYLNELDFFEGRNPTSEELARYFYLQLTSLFKDMGCRVSEVEVWESDNTSVVYFE
ncbi:MAG: 6-carboxytetrahydropterin synthase QueD [Candidatus Cloacimonadia bacterium]|jgi:6-pyruvoyltetrahydropterin/6-carboxytetrahydropterin synthase